MKLSLKKLYGAATGPLGFPMHDADARELDTLLKGLSKECRERGLVHYPTVAKAQDFVENERADKSFVTTDALDRDFEIIIPGGGDWKSFKKNPVVTFAHDYSSPPVGRSMWVTRERKGNTDGWLAKTQYIDRPDGWTGDWMPDAIWHFVKSGYMPGKSIGFIPLNFRAPEEAEIRARPEYAKARRVIDKWMALEYAVCPVQSNPECLVQGVAKAKSAGVSISDETMERIGLILPETMPSLRDFMEDDDDATPEPEQKSPSSSAEPQLPDPATTPVVTVQRYRQHAAAAAKRMLKGLDAGRLLDDAAARRRGAI